MMFKKILVPLDGSQLSQRALGPALALSQQTGAEPLLVRVPTADTLNFAVSEAKQRELSQEAPVYLETIRKSTEQSRFSLCAQVLDGGVASAIADTARRADRSERDSHARLLRPDASGVGQRHRKSLAQCALPSHGCRAARRPQRILIMLGGSTLGEQAIDPGLSLAQSLKAEVALLRCAPHLVTNGKLDEHERGLSRSVTAKVLCSISCSMLVIRPADAELN